uniref:Peptidylprolyl isomerase n=2 Tax=Hemiselmis andersenii TaxID=464988 RepID=A0A7S0TH66_HEMAN
MEESVGAMREACPKYFEEEERLKGEEEKREREEEERRKKEEEENRSSEDHDNRILKFSERFGMAEKNKGEGNELFKDGNCKFAAERYVKALGHLAKLVHIESTMKEEDFAQAKALKLTCYNNLAQCFLKLEAWSKAADNCSAALELDGANAKALFRRAQALVEQKELEKAAEDCRRCLEVNAGDKAVEKLLEKCERGIKAAEAKQKKMYGKMFG